MGDFFSKMFGSLNKQKEYKIIMMGLDSAGKSTILYQVKYGQVVESVPTIGFNCESFQLNNVKLQVWDVGGQDKIRKQWKHYLNNIQGLIYVIDSCDHQRFELAKESLFTILNHDELQFIPILIFLNKIDATTLSINQISQNIGIQELKLHKYLIQPTCALENTGITEGFEWIINQLKNN